MATGGHKPTMNNPTHSRPDVRLIALTLVLVITPPLVGLAVSGAPLGPYLTLPPTPPAIDHPGFSPLMFALYATGIVAVLAPFLVALARGKRPNDRPRHRPWPSWSLIGPALIALCWPLAWGAFDAAPESLRAHAFTPLWLGYILCVQAWTVHRGGRSLLRDAPGRFLALFPASALFWWLFEFLNRFVGNWIYSGTEDYGPIAYVVAASLPFATVIPAVLSTRDLLATFPALRRGLGHGWRPPAMPAGTAPAALAAATVGLALIGPLGDWLFSLLWLAPLAIVTALQQIAGRRHVLTATGRGDWRGIWLAALAGLVCGGFWELWNWRSLPRWEYSIPHVEVLHVFEMPLLGYAGYLPFGLCCVAAAQLLVGVPPEPALQSKR